MLKKTVKWAVGFMEHLLAASIASTTPNTVVDANGAQHILPLNKSALWPPHRYHPTPKREKRGRKAHMRMAVIDGRVTIADVAPKFYGSKGMRP